MNEFSFFVLKLAAASILLQLFLTKKSSAEKLLAKESDIILFCLFTFHNSNDSHSIWCAKIAPLMSKERTAFIVHYNRVPSRTQKESEFSKAMQPVQAKCRARCIR
jgi:hypothetical protein